ncbi:MAG: sulfite exporter TauE/SafE family protein [Xanthobacteraceae bacterium]
MITTILLIAAAFLAGALNSLAGGGTLVTFPALLLVGLNPIEANATSVVALFPATFSSVWAYRRSMAGVAQADTLAFVVLSLAGGLVGALLLLFTPTAIFAALVPWLVLFATIVFAIGNFAPLTLVERIELPRGGALALHFLISIYGGYFGGGIGFLMLAALTVYGMRDINAMNGLKLGVVGVMTMTAIAAFIVAGLVRWAEALPMMVAAMVGGYAAAAGAQRIDQRLVKGVIVVLGLALTVFFFWRGV